MPLLIPNYSPPLFLRNGHVHTIWSYLARTTVKLPFKRSVLKTADQDFVALDSIDKGKQSCILLIHGLEGSAESGYITSLAQLGIEKGYDMAALNLRGCSGEPNHLFRAYHSGAIDDIDLTVDHLRKRYKELYIVGFSLGGNIVLKYMAYLAELGFDKVRASVAISVPCHLSTASDKLERFSNSLYKWQFLISLKAKLTEKIAQHPGQFQAALLKKIRSIRDFDDLYTGPANGFKDSEDYYTQCSSLFQLRLISAPTLLINAQDDPFLSKECMPWKEAEDNPHFFFYAPKYGGHVGFWRDNTHSPNKHEEWALDFLERFKK